MKYILLILIFQIFNFPMAELFANQKDSNTNKSHFDFNDLDTSLIEFIPAETKPSKAITVVVHGLNNKPSIMKSICKMLSEHGSDVILIKLTGHRNDPQNLANITRQIWLTDLLESHNYAKSLIESSEKKPLYFIGYSIGALINLDLISSNPKLVHYDKMILFAPANATKWSTNLLKLSFSLGNEQKIPSFSPKDYRANDGIPIKAYIVLFEMKKSIENINYKHLNIPTIIIIDPKDETISLRGLKKLKDKYDLYNWKIHILDSQFVGKTYKYHHLIVDEISMGTENWVSSCNMIRNFLNL